MSQNPIDHIKRLERFGAEHSKAIQKIKIACLAVAEIIVEADIGNRFPGYKIHNGLLYDPNGNPFDETITREMALDFAKEIAQVDFVGSFAKSE